MRRPAQHRPGLAAARGWTHPYTGVDSLAVFYNDGGQGGGQPAPVPPAPSPADLAQRPPQPPAPVLPQAGLEPLLDKDTGQPLTQAQFNKIMTRENNKGRNKVLRELCEAAGVPFDHENTDVARLTQALKDAETTRQAQLSEDQRRNEELAAREQALAAREAAAQQREAEAARRDRDTRIRSVLVSLGATGDDLEDATRLLAVPADATDEQITQAATDLKARRAVLFGGQAAPQTLPAAPSGGPAGGNAPRQPATTKDAVNEAARARARAMGLRTDDAA
ncbi:hypothetical protein [Streptomyces longwoodensis]|uniref:hypothetical protein n=1 Tax=Streptomyces longwoodensis TaxID=68231 RepID=UPI00224EA318|nr:hypothetical protein [Streptomyces longwoodensis]MCX5000999.1 hypothetical protein [Streptomyces longwoodensis]